MVKLPGTTRFTDITSCCAIGILAVIVGLAYYTKSNYTKQWHEGPKWDHVNRMYDDMAQEIFFVKNPNLKCQSLQLESRFGTTQVYACGDPNNHPVMLFHGIGENSLVYGQWMVPQLVNDQMYTIAVDTICDMGRSNPKGGLSSNCPNGRDEVVEWFMSLKNGLGIKGKPTSLVGYSLGSFLSSAVALAQPEEVGNLVLIAPAAIFAPLNPGWILRSAAATIMYNLLPTKEMRLRVVQWFSQYMQADKKQDLDVNWEYRLAVSEAGWGRLITGIPHAFTMETLKQMNHANPTLLVIGSNETLVDAELALETGKEAGIQMQMYPNAGHLMCYEWPRERIPKRVGGFLRDQLQQ